MTARLELMAIESTIAREIAQGATQRTVAMTYALALRSSWPTDWARVNALIVGRWPKGLERVKAMAWRIMEHGPEGARR